MRIWNRQSCSFSLPLLADSDSTTEVFRSFASPLLKVDFMNPETNPTVEDPRTGRGEGRWKEQEWKITSKVLFTVGKLANMKIVKKFTLFEMHQSKIWLPYWIWWEKNRKYFYERWVKQKSEVNRQKRRSQVSSRIHTDRYWSMSLSMSGTISHDTKQI